MKTPLAIVIFAFSFACGFEPTSTEAIETESGDLNQFPSEPAVERIPITLENPEANAGLDPSGIGYPGWSTGDSGEGFFQTRITYDSTLNSNVFNIITEIPGSDLRGMYSMSQRIPVSSMSEAARDAISTGYPIECEAMLNVSYETRHIYGNLKMQLFSHDENGNMIDSCDKVLSTENRWQATTCGPVAAAGMDSFRLYFWCRYSTYCKIDKVKCNVVKRAGFERFKPGSSTQTRQVRWAVGQVAARWRSDMASKAEIQELKDKVTRLVDTKFKGDWSRAYNYYAARTKAAASVEQEDLLQLLVDAEVGTWATRGMWANGIMGAVDLDKDQRISWTEFESMIRG